MLRSLYAFGRFLLEAVQNIDRCAQFHGVNRSVRVAVVLDYLKHARPRESFIGLA